MTDLLLDRYVIFLYNGFPAPSLSIISLPLPLPVQKKTKPDSSVMLHAPNNYAKKLLSADRVYIHHFSLVS